jgi:hypothetical protein
MIPSHFRGMRRGLRNYLIGSVALVALAGCGRGMMQFGGERETWRHEAEAACLKSGAVKEGAGIVRIEPIEGPGMCGADFPLKVAALGEGPLVGYADDIRPPASIPGGPERWPIAQQPQYTPPAPPPRYIPPAPDYAAPQNAPMSIVPPGAEAPPPRAYEPVATRPAYDPRASTVQPLRVPTAQPQYVQPQDYDDIPDDAIVPDRSRALPRQSYQPPFAPQSELPQLGLARPGPMGTPNIVGKAAVTPAATLACPMVSALDQWVSEAVQPAAIKWFRQPVIEIKQISAYSCRGMVGNSTAHISEHAFGNALDVAGFMLADGRKILVKNGWNGTPEETGFLHDVQMAACERFTTVLAPGYNVYHYDHIHLDLMRRASGRTACRPNAMTGEEAAAKLSKTKYARRDPNITGAVGDKAVTKPRATAGDDGDFDEDLPTGSIKKKYKPQPAIPGEDGDFDDE